MLSSCSREVPPNQIMNLLTKKQSEHKTLKERLKSKNKTIQVSLQFSTEHFLWGEII